MAPGETDAYTKVAYNAARGSSVPQSGSGASATKRRSDQSDEERQVKKSKPITRDARTGCPVTIAGVKPRGSLVKYYQPRKDDLMESADMVVLGEDPADSEDEESKPVRRLDDFTFFDPRTLEFVSLDVLSDPDSRDHCEAAGSVTVVYANEEDEAIDEDEQDLDCDEQDLGEGSSAGMYKESRANASPVRVRLGAIMRVEIDYTDEDGTLWIETQFASYYLRQPSKHYRSMYLAAIQKHLIVQALLVKTLDGTRSWTHGEFVAEINERIMYVTRGRAYSEADRDDMLPLLEDVISQRDDEDELRGSRLIRAAMDASIPIPDTPGPSSSEGSTIYCPFVLQGNGNPDDAVLKRQNQNQTTVTPYIEHLARPWFHKGLFPVGPHFPQEDAEQIREREDQERAFLMMCVQNSQAVRHVSTLDPLRRNEPWMKTVRLDNDFFYVGDVVVIGPVEGVEIPENISLDARLEHYFWFARIMRIDNEHNEMHVHWLEHSSRSVLGEFHDPRELYSYPKCEDQALSLICGKVDVTVLSDGEDVPDNLATPYYCRLLYDSDLGSFGNLLPPSPDPFDPCISCSTTSQEQADDESRETRDGVSCRGNTYHVDDFILIAASKKSTTSKNAFLFGTRGLNLIAQIVSFLPPASGSTWGDPDSRIGPYVLARLFGRVIDLPDDVRHNMPEDLFYGPDLLPEHHLYLTDQEIQIPARWILRRCQVMAKDDAIGLYGSLPKWISLHLESFYVRTVFKADRHDRLNPRSGDLLYPLPAGSLPTCTLCVHELENDMQNRERFEETGPLRVLDLFAGVGGLGLGMELGSQGWMKTTHAVEISPSAAKTLEMNSPGVTVYNQCANVVLKYAIESQDDLVDEIPRAHNGELLPPPPKPGEIDCIVAGFPCQPHSGLNMFKKANDAKSNLVLNLLSWVNHLHPKYCFFENVENVTKWKLHAVQKDKHSLHGGIPMGGVRFMMWAMTMMGYQVRICLMQAAHYGAPQTRVRFFLFAAKRGYPLIMPPGPTHHFQSTSEAKSKNSPKKTLRLKFPDGTEIKPLAAPFEPGRASFPFVTVEDAIGDLPRFDWYDSKSADEFSGSAARQAQARITQASDVDLLALRGDNIDVFEHDNALKPSFVGPAGHAGYYCEPLTAFQAMVRTGHREVTDLQHFTRLQNPATVQRVCHIPLKRNVDYRTLDKDMCQWHLIDPTSSVARNGFKGGIYGRIDKDYVFQTTSTNVEPTAKQSRCLHPWCKRIVTIRELARSQGFPDWFVFHANDDRVKTMQRQIGNAVAWPVSAALGRALRAEAYKEWLRDR